MTGAAARASADARTMWSSPATGVAGNDGGGAMTAPSIRQPATQHPGSAAWPLPEPSTGPLQDPQWTSAAAAEMS